MRADERARMSADPKVERALDHTSARRDLDDRNLGAEAYVVRCAPRDQRALSPDAKGEYALTEGDLGRARFLGQPLVVLAACYSARTALALHESHGLAAAFIRAGARTVLAATQEIPDGEAPRFFDAVLERIRSGEPAAVALRDERVRWTARGGGRWVEQVLLFE